METKALFGVLWIVFFFQGMSMGCWLPALTNILRSSGLGWWVPVVFVVSPVCALFSPIIGGTLADQRMSANRLFVGVSVICSVLLTGAFACLSAGLHPMWFVSLFGLYALFSGPSWGVLTTISLTHLSHGERLYPLVRVGATFGWVAGGLVTSFVLHADASPVAGYAAGFSSLVAGLLGLLLPHTPPLGRGKPLKSMLGLGAFVLMKQRDHRVFFIVTALFSVPLSAFYMYGPEFLKVLGDAHPAGTMTVAQVVEVVCMLFVGAIMVRYRVKVVLLWALGLSVVRFGLSANAGITGDVSWHVGGIALHGICYTLYFVTAQVFLDRRVDPGMKGQAQGLLAMVSGGIGPLVGALVCGAVRGTVVSENGEGWAVFWGILAAMIGVCFVGFAIFYQGQAVRRVPDGGDAG